MREGLRIFCASAFGAIIGGLVMLFIVAYLWWLGPGAGAVVGFVAYDHRAFFSAIPAAWSTTVKGSSDALQSIWRYIWGPHPWILAWTLCPLIIWSSLDEDLWVAVLLSLVADIGVFLLVLLGFQLDTGKKEAKWTELMVGYGTFCRWLFMGLMSPFIWFDRNVQKIGPRCAAVMIGIAGLLWLLVGTTLSSGRLTCAVSSALGVGIGHYYVVSPDMTFMQSGSVLLCMGAIAGFIGLFSWSLLAKPFLQTA